MYIYIYIYIHIPMYISTHQSGQSGPGPSVLRGAVLEAQAAAVRARVMYTRCVHTVYISLSLPLSLSRRILEAQAAAVRQIRRERLREASPAGMFINIITIIVIIIIITTIAITIIIVIIIIIIIIVTLSLSIYIYIYTRI